jgi:acetoacetyl-CoA synthetase
MLLYDGSPFHPRPTILLELAQEVGYGISPESLTLNRLTLADRFIYSVTIFGTSPRYLGDLRRHRIIPSKWWFYSVETCAD